MNELAKLHTRRRIFKALADRAKYPRTRRFYAKEVFMCDEDIARIMRRRAIRLMWIVNLIVLITILCSSCHTINGVGKDLQDWTHEYVERSK